MISTTVAGQACWLLAGELFSASPIRLEVELPANEIRSLTGISSRRPGAVLPRWKQKWRALLETPQFVALRDASLAAQDEPILAPIWRHSWRPASESPTLEGGLVVAWTEGWDTWAINPGSLAGYDYAAPLIFGRFTSPPRLAAMSGGLIEAEIEVSEDAPAAYAILPAAGILAADVLDSGFPVFPFASLVDWSDRRPTAGFGVTDVERIAIGPGRMMASIFYPQTPERVFGASFTGVNRTEAAQLIAWWIRRGGIAEAHRVPLGDLGVLEGGTVTARHTNRQLVLDYTGPLASVELAWRESASEVAIPPGETAGVTLGRLPSEAFFFKIDLDFNGAIQTWYFTQWESGAYVNLIDWAYNACDFDGITESDLEDTECACTFRYFAGGPWDNWIPGNLAARGFLTLYRAQVSPAGVFSGFAQVYQGALTRPDFDGPIVTWRARANALFALMGPTQLMSPVCGTRLFRERCGLARADWIFNASIAAVAGNVITIGTISRANGGALPGGFGAADWFALGGLGWTVSGRPYRMGILSSGALAGGQIVLTLDRPIGLTVGASVTATPGCDRIRASGCTKFSNTDNFRGFDQIPAVSPSFVIPQRTATSAKK